MWAFAKSKKADDGTTSTEIVSEPADATQILHRYGKFDLAISKLKLPKLDSDWCFKDPHLDIGCMLSNGAGLLVDFTLHTRKNKYYEDIDANTSKAYGGDLWMNDFGADMAEKRKEKRTEIEKAREVVEEIMESNLVVGVVTPKKKRRKAPVHG